MIQDDYVLLILAGFVVLIVAALAVTRWRKSRNRASILVRDTTLEEIGMPAGSSLFDSPDLNVLNDVRTLRPSWGIRLIAPALAALVLTTTNFEPVLAAIGLHDPALQSWAILGVSAVLAYGWFMVLAVQRITYDGRVIDSIGMDLRMQHRDLDDLVAIRRHEKRPALILTFAEQAPLHVGGFISDRDGFVRDMQVLADRNKALNLNTQHSSQGLFTPH